ncbi:MAG: DUF1499 domain-containing protein [Gallionella sp.]
MKIVVIILTIIMLMLGYLIYLGQSSKTGSAQGLLNGQLHKCPDNPNCMSSEHPDDTVHFMPPIDIADKTSADALKVLKDIILELNGEIHTDREHYISATFASSIFGFVDDFELRVDPKQQVIHFRSASRVGRDDLSANMMRIKIIKKLYLENDNNG